MVDNKVKNKELVKASTPSPQVTKTKSTLTFCIAFIALIALLISLYDLFLHHQLVHSNKNQAQAIRQQQITEKERITSQMSETKQSFVNLQKEIDTLRAQFQALTQQNHYPEKEWTLLTARYYLELALINTHWTRHYQASVALLQQADALLAQTNSPEIYAIRQAIAHEISILNATPTVDVVGLLSQLDAIQSGLSSPTFAINTDEPATSNESTVNSSWREKWQNNLQLLKQLIIIHHDDEATKPLLTPMVVSTFKESIRLNLQEAQWALLNENPEVYQLALKQAVFSLKRIFNTNSMPAAGLLIQLKALQQIQIKQKKPEAGLALPLLNQLIKQQHSSPTQASSSLQEER